MDNLAKGDSNSSDLGTYKHPNADALWVTHREHDQGRWVQVVTNVHPDRMGEFDCAWAGDIVEGVSVKTALIRGMWSYGVLTKQPISRQKTNRFVPWPSINQLHNISSTMDKDLSNGTAVPRYYRGKTKLHGTNACISVTKDGVVAAQSRKRIITPDSDNANFAQWVDDHEECQACRP